MDVKDVFANNTHICVHCAKGNSSVINSVTFTLPTQKKNKEPSTTLFLLYRKQCEYRIKFSKGYNRCQYQT